MHKSRLITLIKTLSPAEMRRFDTFAASPYFNTQERLLALWRFLHQATPDFPPQLVNRKKAFALMYPGETFEEQKVHDQSSALLKLLERFLAQQVFEEESYEYEIKHLAGLQGKAPDLFSRRFQQASKRMESLPVRDGAYHLAQLQLAQMGDNMGGKLRMRNAQESLVQSMSYLDIHFLATKLRTLCELLNRQKIVQTEYSVAMMDEIESFLYRPDNPYQDIPVVAIYFQVYLMLSNSGETHFRELLTLLDAHNGKFQQREAYSLYAYAQNYCIRQINSGNPAYMEELFQIYQRLLDTQLLLQAGILPHEHYKNITTVGLRLKHFAWVESFLEQYKPRLEQEIRENAYTYNLAVFYMEKGAFKQAMRHLQQVSFTDVYYDLSARAILLRVYYELQEDDSLGYLVHAFRAFLKRNKLISQQHSKNILNLIRFVRQLSRLRQRKPFLEQEEFKNRLQKIQEAVKVSSGISNANWLRSKIQELAPVE